jgi:hypothetical protein
VGWLYRILWSGGPALLKIDTSCRVVEPGRKSPDIGLW